MPSENTSLWSFRKKLLLIVSVLVILVLTVGVCLGSLYATDYFKEKPEYWKGAGTTKDLKDIIIGRCYNYLTTKSSTGTKNCERIWQELTNVVYKKHQCNITQDDYKHLVELAEEPITCNKSLLWSKTNDVVHRFTKVSGHYITLEDTFLGSLFNGLLWCGKSGSSGMNFNSCPAWNECKHNPMSSFWKMASASFARSSCGVVNVMLNGSADGGVSRTESILRTIEVPNMNPHRVSEVRVWVIDDINGPDRYSCDSESLIELKHYIEKFNLTFSCIDNYSLQSTGQVSYYGTTKDLKTKILNRCSAYKKANPKIGQDCNEIFEELEKIVYKKDPCSITPDNYSNLIQHLGKEQIATNKTILWSKTKNIVDKFIKTSNENYKAVANTFVGSMFDDLVWCGMANSSGMNFNLCPAWDECEYNAVRSFWVMTSKIFAKRSSGVVHVMLNGSIPDPVGPILKNVEIPHLDPTKVHLVEVWDFAKSNICNNKTFSELRGSIESRGMLYSCTNSCRKVMPMFSVSVLFSLIVVYHHTLVQI
ncbi:uncharacterized protein O3C94_021696 [Discoglossus pictus]